MGFSQALSGVNAASQQLDVVGNNIANSQTTGFKSSSVQFSDVFANSQVGLGTRVAGVLQDFGNGNLETTGRNLDLAISGTGFYRFEQEGQIGYSRNGQLTMTANGDLVNAQGAKIMGYGRADGNDAFSAVVPGGQPVALNVPADDMPAKATGTDTGVQAVYNLNQATDETKLNTVTLDDGSATGADVNYHYSNSFTVYDSLGNQRNATVYFEKAPTPANTWNGKVALDGSYAAGNDFTLGFDTNGQLNTITQGATTNRPNLTQPQINFTQAQLGGDPAALSFDFDLTGTTQYADDSTQKSLAQDGYSSGSLVGITIADDGTIMRNFTNEKSVAAGQIALANFRNPEGLKASGDNLWVSSAESGAEVIGTAGSGQFGSIESGTLEASNVDLTKELVDLIIAQRNYQANTNSIRTQSEVMDQIAQLR